MKDPAWVAEPGFDLGMLVGGVIVENGVDQFAGRYGALDGVEEADEFLVGMALHAAVLRGKQDEKSTSIRMRKCRQMRDQGRA